MPRRRVFGLIFCAAMSVSSGAFALAPAQVEAPLVPDTPAAPETSAAPASAPATAPGVEALQVTVARVEGIVQVRAGEDQPWQRATPGMVVDENAEFRTSLRSAVQITIPPDQTITLDRLGTIKVVQAISDNGKLKTKIGMKYVPRAVDIESAGQEHEASISSPSSTLAIRGTQVTLFDQRPFNSIATSLTGRAMFKDAKKQVFFGNHAQRHAEGGHQFVQLSPICARSIGGRSVGRAGALAIGRAACERSSLHRSDDLVRSEQGDQSRHRWPAADRCSS